LGAAQNKVGEWFRPGLTGATVAGFDAAYE
jgi:hypothetical protein